MIQKLKSKLIPIIGFAILIYIVLFFYFDSSLLIQSILDFSTENLLWVLALIILSFILKYFRWSYYLKISQIKISIADSVLIFTSGLLMSISPGKIGEFLKSYLVKTKYKIPMSQTNSVVLAERIIEFISLVFLVSSYLILSKGTSEGILYISIFFLIIIFFVFTPYMEKFLNKIVEIIPTLDKYVIKLVEFSNQVKALFMPTHVLAMLLLSSVAWLVECYAVFIILEQFAPQFSIILSSGYYLISILFGAFSMLPAGLGVTEGSLAYFLNLEGISEGNIVTIIFLIRLFTLWIAVFIGFISILIYQRRNSFYSK